jgi:hypothetical protein
MSDYIPEDDPAEEDGYPAVEIVSEAPANSSMERERDFSATRNRLAMAVWISYALISILITAGGLAGKFGPEVVDPVVAAYAASATAVTYFFFRHRSPYRMRVWHDCNCSSRQAR